jgi:hypothetical protein
MSEQVMHTFIITVVQRNDLEPMHPKDVRDFIASRITDGSFLDLRSITEFEEGLL